MNESGFEVKKNDVAHRFEVQLEGAIAIMEYEETGNRVVLPHTIVPRAFEGKGVASALAKAALEDARTRHMTVVPLCSFVSAYVRDHEEYQDLVDPAYRTGSK